MPNTAQLKFQEVDLSQSVSDIPVGLNAVSVRTKRGPFHRTDIVVNSFAQFVRTFGAEVSNLNGPSLVRRALETGSRLRINRVGHYTDPSDRSTLDAVLATHDTDTVFADMGDGSSAFDLTLKPELKGEDYNNLTIYINPASNGNADYFNILIEHSRESDLNELYENLVIPGTPTAAQSTYLKKVSEESKFFTVTYNDLSGETAPVRPADGSWDMQGGDDGTTPSDSDYIGSSAGKTGFYAFDDFDDFELIAALDTDTQAVHTGGASYANNRQDCIYVGHLPNSNKTATDIISAREDTNVDTTFAAFFAGGIKITDPLTGKERELSELGDVLGLAARSAAEYGEWWSFAGPQRGTLGNVLGVVNNFGTPGTLAALNELARHQINTVINRDGRIMLWGNFTAQLANTRKSFLNVRRLLIHIRKSLKPLLENYLEEPNDPITWSRMYQAAKPYMDSLLSPEKRALVDYDWRGDQFAASESDYAINDPADVSQGKYLIEVVLKEVVSLQELTIKFISAPGGVDVQEV